MHVTLGRLRLITSGIAAFAIGYAITLAATSAAPPKAAVMSFRDTSFAPIGGIKPSPYGWQHFCAARPEECAQTALEPTLVRLTAGSWDELNAINRIVNREIDPIGDEDHYHIYEQDILNWWTYPDDGRGNCNDYVLMKRRLLIEAGWPRSALLMTVVIDHHGDGHLILMARTDRGDLILDNMREEIVPWDHTGYRFVKRQSAFNHNDWVAILPPPEARTVASAQR
jgi:predicted transglutaminase-like cysteine proteinase